MWKLICANTFVMLRSKRLWIGAAALIAYDLGIMNFTMSGPQGPGLAGLEARVFGFLGLAALLVPVVTVLFVNTDYHDGTIRSKLAVGHSRAAVYLANLLVSAFMLDPWELAVRMGASVLVLLSMTAVTVAVSMLMAHRAVTVVVIIMMALLLDGASLLENCLAQPQEVRDVVGTVEVVNHEGETVLRYVDREGRELKVSETEMVPNPYYIGEPLRAGLCLVNDLLPGGQIFHLMGLTQRQVPAWSVGLNAGAMALLSTALGLGLFRRKDLK